MEPADLRALSQEVGIKGDLHRRLWKALRYAANEIERLRSVERHAAIREDLYDEVVDNLASAEREKLQQQVAGLRARIAVLSGDSAED
jgi:ABC-type phosphate transport system auxiliary subunit